MQDKLTPRERIQGALSGSSDIDRVPIGLWQHFPGEDDTSDGLINATLRFQHQFQPDFVKLMPTGMYSVVHFGVQIEPTGDSGGTTRFVSGPIHEPGDWEHLPPLSPGQGVLSDHVEVTRRVREELFDLADRYPIDAVNWHDRETPPSLNDALSMTSRRLAGGINRAGVIGRGSADEARAEVRDAVEQTDGRRLIVAPGCVISCDAPEDNLPAARDAVGEGFPGHE